MMTRGMMTWQVTALEDQSSSAHIQYGVGGSLVQASTGTMLAAGRDVALLHVESANYPASLSSAKRMKSAGRLAIGDVTRKVFGMVGAKTGVMTPRQRVRPLGEEDAAPAPSAILEMADTPPQKMGRTPSQLNTDL